MKTNFNVVPGTDNSICIPSLQLRTSLLSIYEGSLYKRLGSYDAIAAITDDFLIKLIANEQMERFFFGASESTRTRRRQYIVDFLCSKTGGPCAYTGRSMKDAHKGLSISENDWSTLANLFQESLNKFKLPNKEIEETMALIASLKVDIVELN